MYLTKDVLEHVCNNVIEFNLTSNAFVDFMPDAPDDVLIISEYGGKPLGDETTAAFRNLQIKVRASGQLLAKELVYKVYRVFNIYELHLSDRKCLVNVQNTPFKTNIDKTGRYEYCFNITLTTLIL